jgi:hypothetical protein
LNTQRAFAEAVYSSVIDLGLVRAMRLDVRMLWENGVGYAPRV